MKIVCEKCNHDLTLQVNKHFDSFEVGQVQCPECQKIQSRYISESDILLYLGMSELLYLALSVITLVFFYNVGISFWLVPVFLVMFAIGFFVQRKVSYYIYTVAPMKQDYKNVVFKEDVMQIKRSNNWQFILFFALAITAVTGTTFQLFFLVVAILAIILTFVKFFLCIKKERREL